MTEKIRENQCSIDTLNEKMMNTSTREVTIDESPPSITARKTAAINTSSSQNGNQNSIISTKALNNKLSIISQIPSRAVDDVEETEPQRMTLSNDAKTFESWEDEIGSTSSSSDENDEFQCPLSSQQPHTFPLAPPPTPISPLNPSGLFEINGPYKNTNIPYSSNGIRHQQKCQLDSRTVAASAPNTSTRPDKTDAIAKRLISGALGMKPAPKTKEQRAYEVAMMEKEIKKRREDKQALIYAQEEMERSKLAIWSD